ncbi:hypothetical protein AB0E27_41410 [Streptomyces sparsogenes]|uniref:hypothetical protein n=1 Tax=Streptomyces sparsogenes TaxID=67365 RepID=UPI00340AE01B
MTRGMYPRYYEDGEGSWREHTRDDWQQQRLVVERMGHEVAVDHRGLLIDGRRIVADGGLGPSDALRQGEDPSKSPAFQILTGGSVVYHGRVVAELSRTRSPCSAHKAPSGLPNRRSRRHDLPSRRLTTTRWTSTSEPHHQSERSTTVSTTNTGQDTENRARQQEVAGLLPVLAQLDRTATELEQSSAIGKEVTDAEVGAYQQQAAHARHLVTAAGATAEEITEAEKEHRGDGDKGFAARGLDHTTHPRIFEPTQPLADSTQDRDRSDEEIDL